MVFKLFLIYQITLLLYYVLKDILWHNIQFSDLIKRFYNTENSKTDIIINTKSVGESKAILSVLHKLEEKNINVKLCVNLPEGYYFIKNYTNKVFLKPYNTILTTLLLFIYSRPSIIISPNGDFKDILYLCGKIYGTKIYFINYYINNSLNIRHSINNLLADRIYLGHPFIDTFKKYEFMGNLKFLYSSISKLDKSTELTLDKSTELTLDKSTELTLIIASASCEEIDIHIKYIKHLLSNYTIKIIYVPRYLDWLDTFKKKIININHQFISDLYNDNEIHSDLIIYWNIGLLNKFYSKSHICLMGDTFNKVGGHNLMEPSVQKNAILTGPNINSTQLNIMNNRNLEELISNTDKIITNKLYINMGLKNYKYVQERKKTVNNNLDLFINKISCEL